jgi:hypothetical protein
MELQLVTMIKNMSIRQPLDNPATAFATDSVGNKIVPKNCFGGFRDITVTEVKLKDGSKTNGVDVVSVIMAVEGKDRKAAAKVWRERIQQAKKTNICEDLLEGIIYKHHFFL